VITHLGLALHCPYRPECATCSATGSDDVCLPHERGLPCSCVHCEAHLDTPRGAQLRVEASFPANPEPKSESGDASKKDAGKLRYDLIPVGPLRELARVYTIGAEKYAPRGWESGMDWSRIIAAMQRHVEAWRGGETHDAVDGQHHLSSVAWCAFALMEFERTHPELDDRP